MPIAGQRASIRSTVVAAVDRAFAEPVRLSFFAHDRPDPDRKMVEIMAVIRVGSNEDGSVQSGPANKWRTQVAAGEAELHIDAASYSGPSIREGDRVSALDRPGQPWWKIATAGDRPEGRLIYGLSEI